MMSTRFVGAGEGYLVEVAVNLLGGHADATVRDGDGSGFLVDTDGDLQVAQFALEIALAGQCLQLLGGVDGVRDNLANEYFVI